MPVNVEKRDGETNESLLRRFTKKVQSTGLVRTKKEKAFKQVKKNDNKKRKEALAKKQIKEQYDYLRKTGRLEELANSPSAIKKCIKIKK